MVDVMLACDTSNGMSPLVRRWCVVVILKWLCVQGIGAASTGGAGTLSGAAAARATAAKVSKSTVNETD